MRTILSLSYLRIISNFLLSVIIEQRDLGFLAILQTMASGYYIDYITITEYTRQEVATS